MQVSNDIDAPIGDPDFYVYRALKPWTEASTWDSLGNGLQGNELSSRIATIEGDNHPNNDGLRRVNVTAAVQAWANGAKNHGLAILPKIVAGNDDGIDVRSSENGNTLLRPRLEVVYQTDCGYTTYGSKASPANTMNLFGLGFPSLGGYVEVATEAVPAGSVPLTAVSLRNANFRLFGGVMLIDLGTLLQYQPVQTSWAYRLPNQASLAGLQLYFQSVARDRSKKGRFALSNGLRVKICQ